GLDSLSIVLLSKRAQTSPYSSSLPTRHQSDLERRPGRLCHHCCRGAIAYAVQQAREITLGARHEQWSVVLRRPCDDGTEHLFGVAQPPRKAQGHGEDSQVLRLEDAVVPRTVDRRRFLR